MLDRESSLRIKLVRFPVIAFVVFAHAYSTNVVLSGVEIGMNKPMFVSDFVRNFISHGLIHVAVPLFFLMSGYLFFLGFEWSKERYLIKLKSRIRSLLIPYLIWNILVLSLDAVGQAVPATRVYFSGNNVPVAAFSSFDYLNSILGLNSNPVAYQFWFIRDLMIMVLLAPFINILNRVVPRFFLSILLICWLSVDLWMPSSSEGLPAGLLFFSLGAYLASSGKSLFSLDRFGTTTVCLYFIFVTIDALAKNYSFNDSHSFYKLSIIFGVPAALFLTKLVVNNEKIKSSILRLDAASFFIFAIHEPLLTMLRKIAYRIIPPNTQFMILFWYFVIPITIIVFGVFIYRNLAVFAPKIASIVTGGREYTRRDSIPDGHKLGQIAVS
ncbi:MAG: acyltransferase family protein [Desulfomonilaceae bacterium]